MARGVHGGDAFSLDASFDTEMLLEWSALTSKGRHKYGYVTERCDTSQKPTRKQVDDLVERIKGIAALKAPQRDFEENDDNYGFSNGELVFIDFDDGTWSSEDDGVDGDEGGANEQ